ncbi:hypothetical protein COOONC_08862, partial [Cooperia oncophora]
IKGYSQYFRWSVRENDGEFRNEVCSVRYDNKEQLAQPPLFGAMFHFTLDSQVNCPEFLAYFPLVEQAEQSKASEYTTRIVDKFQLL